jgi:hypothetical protein
LGVFYIVYGVDQLFLNLFLILNFSSLEQPFYTPGQIGNFNFFKYEGKSLRQKDPYGK